MRLLAIIWVLPACLAVSCQANGPLVAQSTASPSSSPGASPFTSQSASPIAPSESPSPVPTVLPTPLPPGEAYGLLLTGGTLELIKPDATIAATTSVTPGSVEPCPTGQGVALLQPPVSASNALVYFRDGDTTIRSLSAGGRTADVTTVPGGPNTASFFSVSPDDQRIAVIVEDLAPGATVRLRLYVEDLIGHGHHVDLPTAASFQQSPVTWWPVGWHKGALVLAQLPLCTFQQFVEMFPSEWDVIDVGTGAPITTIRPAGCNLSYAPSPAGVGCTEPADQSGSTTLYDWTGKTFGSAAPGAPTDALQSGLSPNGRRIFFPSGSITNPDPRYLWTEVHQVGGATYYVIAHQHRACAWIDDDHLLAPDSVISIPTDSSGVFTAQATPFASRGVCAGRFPGAL